MHLAANTNILQPWSYLQAAPVPPIDHEGQEIKRRVSRAEFHAKTVLAAVVGEAHVLGITADTQLIQQTRRGLSLMLATPAVVMAVVRPRQDRVLVLSDQLHCPSTTTLSLGFLPSHRLRLPTTLTTSLEPL